MGKPYSWAEDVHTLFKVATSVHGQLEGMSVIECVKVWRLDNIFTHKADGSWWWSAAVRLSRLSTAGSYSGLGISVISNISYGRLYPKPSLSQTGRKQQYMRS